MYIKVNKEDLAKIIHLLETKEENTVIASYLNELCFSMDQFDFINEIDVKDNKSVNENSKKIIYETFELDEDNKENIEIIDRHLDDSFTYVDLAKYEENSYKINVNPKEIEENSYKIHYLFYPSGSFFPLDDIKVIDKDYYLEKSIIGISKDSYKFLTLSKNNDIWMCITPNEINTMKPHIEKAKGDVVTFGLGLGYYAYMVANKKEVRSVTIVEKDEEIINLFSNHILPLFKNKEKIKIIKEDAIKYIKSNHLSIYDYAFFDSWHNAEDGLPLYLQIKKLDIHCPTSFWIEESIICMYRRCFLTVIEESLQGYNDDDYRKAKNPIERVINEIYFKTKTIRINNFEYLNTLLSKENLLKLIESK